MPLLKGYFIFNDTIQTFEVNIEYLLRSLRYLKINFAYLERLLLYLQQHRTKIKLKIQIHPKYEYLRKDILDIVAGNYIADKVYCNKRNTVEKVTIQECEVVVKKYKTPNIVNQIAYSHLRKSKARRAYEYALRLLENGVDTPFPIAYIEITENGLFKSSYFIAKYTPARLMRDLFTGVITGEEKKHAIEELTDFTIATHTKKILPLDYNPDNIFYTVDKENGHYSFALTDINRMKFDKEPTLDDALRSFHQFGAREDTFHEFISYYCKKTNTNIEHAYKKFVAECKKDRSKSKMKRKAKKVLKISK